MKLFYFLLFTFFLGLIASAQNPSCTDKFEQTRAMERNHAASFMNRGNETLYGENFDVKYYRCYWEIDPSVRYITGQVTMYFTPNVNANNMTLDLANSLTVDSITRKNISVTFGRPQNGIQINFAQPLAAGVLDSVTIFYHGIPDNTGFGSFITYTHGITPVAWSLSEPYGSRDWWPCKTNLGDKADSIDVFVKHPSIYKAASNGILQSESPAGTGEMLTHWKHRYPIASYLICFAVTNYSVFNNSVMLGNVNLPMQTYCYPENLALFQANTPLVLSAMQLFHASFGPYPFIKEKYGHVQFGWGGGMEHQSSTFIVTPDEGLMAHELGHQWFGDKLTTNSWEDIWLNEGFATYLAMYYMENKYPASKITNRKNVVNNITSAPGGSVRVEDTTSVNRIFSGRLSYNKGSYLLNMLRFMLGDSTFFQGMRKYSLDPSLEYKFVTTADFKRNMETASGKDLTTFFTQWFTGQGYPSYHVTYSLLGGSAVKIKLNQTTSDNSVPFFQMPVPLLFKNGTQQKTIVVNNTINDQQFIQEIGFVPDTVLVDPEYWLISKNNTAQKVSSINNGEEVLEIYPNPVNGPLTFYLHGFSSKTAVIRIYNSLGQVMYTRNINLINGSEYFTLPTTTWSRGTYIVQCITGDKKIVRRIVK